MKKSKRVFDSTFKEKLICKGCGNVFLKFYPSFNQCNVCFCCHSMPLSEVFKACGRIWMRVEVDVMHEVWAKVGVRPMFTARMVKSEVISYLDKIKKEVK